MSEYAPFPAGFLNVAGINRQHVFELAALPTDIAATLGDTAGLRQLILLGHGGRRLWECVKASGIDGPDPIDDYCVHTVRRWFAEHLPGRRFRIAYPGSTPVGLQGLGKLAGWHHASPFMVGIDGEWGSWFAYRAAVLADTDFCPFLPVDRRHPCLDCPDQPCLAACPAEALNGGFALGKCLAYRRQPESACQFTCQARLACPLGTAHRYDEELLRHSYGRSLQTLRQFS